MFPVRYELIYIPEDSVLHSHRRENFKSYKAMSVHSSASSVMAKCGVINR
jgi:hypothetical protein